MSDIVVTWPQDRPLQSYLDELARAALEKKLILYKVGQMPRRVMAGDWCYMVHSGQVRGWVEVYDLRFPNEGQPPIDPISGERMGEGAYIVRSPIWHRLLWPIPMKGFQGVRYAPKWWRERVSVG